MTGTSSTVFKNLGPMLGTTQYTFRFAYRRPWTAFFITSAALLAMPGCRDGTVVANGHVLIEGAPASGGRLMLMPVAGGMRAFSLVDENGAFALRMGDTLGAIPGEYRLALDQPLDAKSRAEFAKELAGQLSVDDMTVIYRGPRDKALVIPATGDTNLVIDVRKNEGWTHAISD